MKLVKMGKVFVESLCLAAMAAGAAVPVFAVSEQSSLPAAEQTSEEQEAAELKAKLKKLRKNYDDVENITFYNCAHAPYVRNKAVYTYVLPYFYVVDGEVSQLKIVYDYCGRNWLFWNTAIYSVDGENLKVEFDDSELIRGTSSALEDGSALVYEYTDTVATEKEIEFLQKIAESDKAVIRLKGRDRQHDLSVPKYRKKDIAEILDVYNSLISASPEVRAKALEN